MRQKRVVIIREPEIGEEGSHKCAAARLLHGGAMMGEHVGEN